MPKIFLDNPFGFFFGHFGQSRHENEISSKKERQSVLQKENHFGRQVNNFVVAVSSTESKQICSGILFGHSLYKVGRQLREIQHKIRKKVLKFENGMLPKTEVHDENDVFLSEVDTNWVLRQNTFTRKQFRFPNLTAHNVEWCDGTRDSRNAQLKCSAYEQVLVGFV